VTENVLSSSAINVDICCSDIKLIWTTKTQTKLLHDSQSYDGEAEVLNSFWFLIV